MNICADTYLKRTFRQTYIYDAQHHPYMHVAEIIRKPDTMKNK